MKVRINLNDNIRYRLTEIGRKVYAKYWRDCGMEPPPIVADADGWIEDQLWVVMHRFGPAIDIGFDQPIETTIEVEVQE